MSSDDLNILEYWHVIVRRKKFIATLTSVAAAISIIISLLLPKVYSASASVLPPQQESGLASGLLSQVPGNIGGLAGSLLGMQSKADVWVGILKSQTVRDAIITRFNLRERYKADNIEDTRKVLDKMVIVRMSEDDEIISITVEDKEPAAARDMANAFIEELDRVNRTVVTTSGRRTREFVHKRLSEAGGELKRLEGEMKSFQERHGAVQLDEQGKAIIESMGKVKGALIAKEVELQTLMSYAAPTNPHVSLLKHEIDGLRAKLSEFEHGGNLASGSVFIPTSRLPSINIQFARKLREAAVQQTLYEFLTQQYELARIQEAKDSPTVQVLDYATTPEKKSKPKRSLIVLLSTFTALCFGVFYSLLGEYMKVAGMGQERSPSVSRAE